MTSGVVVALGKNAKDISGQTFGRLTVLRAVGRDQKRNIIWLCQCRCGNVAKNQGYRLKSGNTTSCGCAQREHCTTHKQSGSRTYGSWVAMRRRCSNPDDVSFHNYAGRGITICARWNRFENFLEDLGERPPGKTLERINNDGNYEPGNCRWATQAEQCRNTRQNHYLTYKGETLLISDWAKRLGVKTYVLCHRVAMGWSDERVIGQPFNRRFHASSPAPWQESPSASKTPDNPPADSCSIR